ncbi:hypothetical protein P4534_00440 [Peribacillus butanolivorans]|uniref:hypothetical protein n=1 Tax=Peribacillus butanolivorans TaxID=421767 RepID=UPI002E1DC161|nr:hypothetical protein [Peribacillus butanolivorans]
MTVRELYHESVKHKHTPLRLLIEFLVYEKNTVNFADDKSVLDLYFKENNRPRMNELLKEYQRSIYGSAI